MRSWQPAKSVDILISELLGSFGDNELSPECLDGAQKALNRITTCVHCSLSAAGGISIPSSYTAHISPIASSKHHSELLRRTKTDDYSPFETPYVVWLQAYDHLATSVPEDQIQKLWEFKHPNAKVGTAGNSHNKRLAMARFRTSKARSKINGIAGYFEAVLYKDIELSTRPDQIDIKSLDMFSWFPAYFPLKVISFLNKLKSLATIPCPCRRYGD
jgi:type II protein arginine methyltransferase